MDIVVNLRQYYKGCIGGIEHYVVNVLSALEGAGHSLTILAPRGEEANIRTFAPGAEILEAGPEGGANVRDRILAGGCDLLFCPLLVLEPLNVSVPSVVFIPDIQHEFYPEYFPARVLQWRRRNFLPSAENASVVLTCSEYAKQTIVGHYGVAPEKVQAVYPGVEDDFRRPPSASAIASFRRLGLPERYFFLPANYWPHKNHVSLLKALQRVHAAGMSDIQLVFTGAAGPDRDRVAGEIQRLGLTGSVRLLDYQPRGVLPEIYRHSRGLVFATQHEGFGIPVLEAMSLGVPVITSRGGATEEVAAGAAFLVEAKDPASIAESMERLAGDRGLSEELARKGRQRAADFAWKKSTSEVLRTFERIAREGARSASRATEVAEYPVISVVTPSMNMGRQVEKAIESVLSQDYPHVEYVVMDGGSTDGTLEILRHYEGRLRWRSEPDHGQADAVNKGFALTRGKVFAFLKPGDTYRPGALAAAGDAFRSHPRAGLVYGEAYDVGVSGAILRRHETQPLDYEDLNYGCHICQPAAFVSRDAFQRAGMLDTSLHLIPDYDLWIRIAAENQMVHIARCLADRCIYPGIKTLRDGRAVYREVFSTVRKHFSYVPYSWLNGYACQLVGKGEQFFEQPVTTWPARLLSLYLGLKMNPGQRRRYLADWDGLGSAGAAGFDGQWEDGWVSRRFRRTLHLPPGPFRLRITGRHASPFLLPLHMQVRLDGTAVGEKTVYWRGPFRMDLALSGRARPRAASLVLEFNKAWRPGGLDQRMLACILEQIEIGPGDHPA